MCSLFEQHDVTIIIRTALSARRGELIRRAVHSITSQSGVRARPFLLANGANCDPRLYEEFANRTDVEFVYVDRISLSDAILMGREQVTTPYFGFLDDDDMYLPGALSQRVARLGEADRPDVVVSGGVRMVGNTEVTSGASIAEAKHGPEAALTALLDNAWLTPAGGLFRTDTVAPAFFRGAPPFHEWTYLACRMILGLRIAFLDTPGYFMNDSEVSESKSFAYDIGAVDALARILELNLPASIRPLAQRKLSAAQHFASVRCLEKGDLRDAWRFHLDSLRGPGGLAYLAYTRHLLLAAAK